MNKFLGPKVRVAHTLGLCALALTALARAADLDPALQAAAVHASLAASSTRLEDVRMHVHHAINCLVGPKGAEFDASQANPCAALGNGVLADAGSSPKRVAAEHALADGKAALAAATLEAARAAAGRMQASLK